MFLIIFGMVLGLDVLFWWWADRRARRLPRPRAWRVSIALFVGLQLAYAISMLAIPGFRFVSHHYIPPWAMGIMYVWHLIILPLWAIAAGAAALGRLVAAAVRLMASGKAEAESSPPEEDELARPAWTRRQVLAAAAIAAPPLLTLGMTSVGVSRLSALRVREMEVTIAGLPPALDGLRIAHVTDVHVGRYTRGAQLRAIAEATNKLEADLVLMTGDLLDGSLLDLPEALDFVKMIDPRQGLAMCEGNHDLFGGADRFRQPVKAAGVGLLVGEAQSLEIRGESVRLLGTRWSRGEERIRATVEDVLPLRDPGAFNILLAHHPHCFDYAAPAGIPLTLAGHTHGGQLMLSEHVGFGPLMFRYWTGQYARDDAKLVVSNGAGNWFPLRTAAPAEVIHLTLRQA